jgi:ABC-2 type transport system permease protein
MSNFVTQAVLSFKGLFPWLRLRTYIGILWIRPVSTVAMFAIVGRFASGSDAAERYLLGIAAAQMVNLLSTGILRAFADDLWQGTLTFVLSSRVNRLSLYWARGVPHALNGIVAFVTCIASVWLLLGLDVSRANWSSFGLAALSIAWSTTALALLTGSFVIAARENALMNQLINGVLIILTGAVIPISQLPGVLQTISNILPMRHGLEGLREAFSGASLQEVGSEVGLEVAIGFVLAVAGLAAFRYVEVVGRRRGFLEGMG